MNKTKVAVPPPPRRTNKVQFAGSAPTLQQTPQNLAVPSSDDEIVFLNFKVAPSFHRRFKVEASERGMSMKELMEAAFKHYLEDFPLKPDQRVRKPEQVDIFKG